MSNEIDKLIKECHEAAQFYELKPGLAGRPEPIIDLYRTIALLASLIKKGAP